METEKGCTLKLGKEKRTKNVERRYDTLSSWVIWGGESNWRVQSAGMRGTKLRGKNDGGHFYRGTPRDPTQIQTGLGSLLQGRDLQAHHSHLIETDA